MATRNVCRLCSMSGDDYIDIFSEIGINMKLRDIIAEHFKCEVNISEFFFSLRLKNKKNNLKKKIASR